MNLRIGFSLIALCIFVSGCASTPQQPVQLSQDALSAKSSRIGVAMKTLPKVDTYFPGANCLMCLGAASIANSALTKHTQTLPYEDLPKLKDEVATLLGRKGIEVTVIPETIDIDSLSSHDTKAPNIARKDFSPFKQKYKVDKLVVIDIDILGMERTYSSYFPTNAPTAVLKGTGYLVNLSNNAYEWYMPISITRGADGNWDEPPKFPGLTNAYFTVLEEGKDSFLKPFSN